MPLSVMENLPILRFPVVASRENTSPTRILEDETETSLSLAAFLSLFARRCLVDCELRDGS